MLLSEEELERLHKRFLYPRFSQAEYERLFAALVELEWFIKAAEPFQGMEVNVLSETIPTHTYESETLTKAFEEITGITDAAPDDAYAARRVGTDPRAGLAADPFNGDGIAIGCAYYGHLEVLKNRRSFSISARSWISGSGQHGW